MTPATRQIVIGLLIAAATAALALLVFSTFRRVLEPPDPDRIAARTIDLAGTTTTGSPGGGTVAPGGAGGENRPASGQGGGGSQQGEDRGGGVCAEPPPRNPQGTVVMLFFTCGSGPVPNIAGNAYRIVPATERRLTATLTELVGGPDAEERELGFTSVFTEDTSGIFAGVVIDDGTALVDFVGLEAISELDRATVANDLIASLNATVFQFDTVDAVEYRVGGSCQTFWAALGADCTTTSRREWERQLAAWQSGD
jgi:hypothetical protein